MSDETPSRSSRLARRARPTSFLFADTDNNDGDDSEDEDFVPNDTEEDVYLSLQETMNDQVYDDELEGDDYDDEDGGDDNGSGRTSDDNRAGVDAVSFYSLATVGLALALVAIHHMHLSMAKPVAPGFVLKPGSYSSRCGLIGYKQLFNCEDEYLRVGYGGIATLYDANHNEIMVLPGGTCDEEDCVDGLVMNEDDKTLTMGGKPVKQVLVRKSHRDHKLSPWPFAEEPAKLKYKVGSDRDLARSPNFINSTGLARDLAEELLDDESSSSEESREAILLVCNVVYGVLCLLRPLALGLPDIVTQMLRYEKLCSDREAFGLFFAFFVYAVPCFLVVVSLGLPYTMYRLVRSLLRQQQQQEAEHKDGIPESEGEEN